MRSLVSRVSLDTRLRDKKDGFYTPDVYTLSINK